jgi:hypothetical protein
MRVQVSWRLYPKLKDVDEVLGGPEAWSNAQITDGIFACARLHVDTCRQMSEMLE